MNALLTTTNLYGIARFLSAAAGVGSVWAVFRIGMRLFDRATALVSALFLALAFLHVRDSHFGVTDVAATFGTLVAFLFAARLMQTGALGDLLAAGVAAGLATSTKYNVALVVLPILVAVLGHGAHEFARRLRRMAILGLVMAAAFLAASPYSLLDWRHFVEAVRSESAHLAAGHGLVVGRGWIVHLTQTLRYGLGWPILLAGVSGLGWLIWTKPRVGVFVGVFPLAYFLLLGSGYTVFARYMIPVVPFLCLTAGCATAEIGRRVALLASRPTWAPAIVTASAAVMLIPSTWSVVRFDRLLSMTDNRLVAAAWIERRFPQGATVAQLGPEGGHVFLSGNAGEESKKFAVVTITPETPLPDIVVVQSSPLFPRMDSAGPVSGVLAQRYQLGADLTVARDDPRNAYDRQDEFYLPFAGFHAIDRPGPNLRIYVRRPNPSLPLAPSPQPLER